MQEVRRKACCEVAPVHVGRRLWTERPRGGRASQIRTAQRPPQYLNFLPDPHGHRLLRPTFLALPVGLAGLARLRGPLDFVPNSIMFDEAFSVFRSQGSLGLSFTDACIVATANRLGAEFVATFGAGFDEVEGLEVVPAT